MSRARQRSNYIFWTVLVLLGGACSQDPPGPDPVLVITETAGIIDQMRPRLDSTVIDLPDSSTEGGFLLVHSKGDTLQRLQATYYGEIGRSIERFYVNDRDLLLAVRIEEFYDEPMSGHVVRRTTDSVWFEGDSVLAWKDELGPRGTQQPSQVRAHGIEVRKVFLATIGLLPPK
jgi:hypothetical protein